MQIIPLVDNMFMTETINDQKQKDLQEVLDTPQQVEEVAVIIQLQTML